MMKDHLINKVSNNNYSIYSHRIILIVLLIILIYGFALDYSSNKKNFINLHYINLYLNILYYLLCFISDLGKKDTKKYFQIFFHFCFSISSSLPFIYVVLGIMNLEQYDFHSSTSLISLGLILSPIIFNFLETLIIKRNKPAYINPIFLILFLTLYYCLIHFLGKIGIEIGDFYSKYLLEIKYLIPIYASTLFGAFLGWWIYQIVTRPKVKKIDLKKNLDSSELSDE